jgi:hypothetical protein
MEFCIATWIWIGKYGVWLVRNFFQSGNMSAHVNDTHIALIPKKTCSSIQCHLQNYSVQCHLQKTCSSVDSRPISLFNAIFKIIAKCRVNKLKPHFLDYIHPSQQTFIEGRRFSS